MKYQRNTASKPYCPPQIPYDMTWDRARAATVGSRPEIWHGKARNQHEAGSKQGLRMEAICSSESSVDFHWTIRRYIPEDRTLHIFRCENLKSCTLRLLLETETQSSYSGNFRPGQAN
jgi:hypothetical protein